MQVIKERSGSRLTAVHITVVYGDPDEVLELMGGHTADVERTNLTSRQMNGRLVRKSLSYSKQREALEAACAWEDWVYNLTHPVESSHCGWMRRTDAGSGRRRQWRQA